MTRLSAGRVALVFRADASRDAAAEAKSARLAPMSEALADVGITARSCVFAEDRAEEVRRELSRVDGVLVWVDPVTGNDDRSILDALLRDVAAAGVWVSAHPDVILRMGTKQVLYDTRELGWGSDVDVYRSLDEMRDRLPARLAGGRGARVLKQHRGNGGIGVWKVECLTPGATLEAMTVRVQGARRRDETTEDLPLGELIERQAKYFEYANGTGRVIDQPFQRRISEGMCRCYMVKREVVGFCRQHAADGSDPGRVFGLPSAKTMLPRDAPELASLRRRMETEWVAAMQSLVGVDDRELPLLWDADFLFGDRRHDGDDEEHYVLCEINVSAVTPFPPEAPAKVARAALAMTVGS